MIRDNMATINIAIEHIHPHPDNPRKDLGDLSELVESIKKNGVMQNLTVIPMDDSDEEYITIIGHRRCAAAREAGVKELPCRIIYDMSYKEQVSTMLEENMQRNDLTVLEQAQGFQMMLDLGETESSIADKTGFSKQTIKHRLNIAKLDPATLKKKESDNSFQLSLTDLYALEQIKNVKTRNKILKDATNSRELVWKAQNEARNEKRDENAKAIAKLLDPLGIVKAPKNAEYEQYSDKWELVRDFPLNKDIPSSVKIKPTKDKLYYLNYYGSVRIIKRAVKKSPTAADLKQKQKDKRKKEIKSRIKNMDNSRRDFVLSIISGKIKPIKDEGKIRDAVWNVILESGCYMEISTLKKFYSGKNIYDMSPEEKKETDSWIKKTGVLHQMLAIMSQAMEGLGDIYNWKVQFKPDIGMKLSDGYLILKQYGWTFENEDDEKILDGTHELYTEAEGHGK